MAAVGLFGPASLDIDAAGPFSNDGALLAARNGSLTLFFGTNPGVAQVVPNHGLIEALPGGNIDIKAINGSVLNTGRIVADGGTVVVAADVTQQKNGTMAVAHNGTLELADKTSGGTIAINSGTLRLDGPQPLMGLAATVGFTGESGTIDFGGISVTENYSAMLHSLVVTVLYAPGETGHAEIALPPTGFSAANFSVQGHDVIYTAHPSA
jgi:hypothetical protein